MKIFAHSLRIRNYSPLLAFVTVYILLCTIIYSFGVNIPYWDQWDAEADLYLKYVEGRLRFSDLLNPHNEHRIFVTRVFNIGIFSLLGGWAPKIGMYIQSLLPAFLSFLLIDFLRRIGKLRVILWILVVLTFSLPYYWEDILWSFQNQFYFMLLFGSWAFMLHKAPMDRPKLFGIILLSALLPFTVASGILGLLCLCMFSIFRSWNETKFRMAWILIGIFQFIYALMYLKYFFVSSLAPDMQANSVLELTKALFQILSWPKLHSGALLLLSLPLFLVLFRRDRTFWPVISEAILIFIVIWNIGQLLALSFGRANGVLYSSRYSISYSFYALSATFYLSYRLSKFIIERYLLILQSSLAVLLLIYSSRTELNSTMTLFTVEKKKSLSYLLESGCFQEKTSWSDDCIPGFLHPKKARVREILNNPSLQPYHIWLNKYSEIK